MITEVWRMQANNSITLLPIPITINIGEWIINNIGMVAAAKRVSSSTATLYAVEKADVASPQMVKYAKDNDAMILVGISEGEIYAID